LKYSLPFISLLFLFSGCYPDSATEIQPAKNPTDKRLSTFDKSITNFDTIESTFAQTPCSHEIVGENIVCADITLPQNYQDSSDGTITLKMAIVKKNDSSSNKVPIYFVEGREGKTALKNSEYWSNSDLRTNHDIILFDKRGEGSSLPKVDCSTINTSKKLEIIDKNVFTEAFRFSFFSEGISKSAAESHVNEQLLAELPGSFQSAYDECNSELVKQGVKISNFTRQYSAIDMEMIRRSLLSELNISSDKVILYGIGQGSRLVLEAAPLMEGHIEVMILDSVLPTTSVNPIIEKTLNKKIVLDKYFEDFETTCAADVNCSSLYLSILLNKSLKNQFLEAADALKYRALKIAFGTADVNKSRNISQTILDIQYPNVAIAPQNLTIDTTKGLMSITSVKGEKLVALNVKTLNLDLVEKSLEYEEVRFSNHGVVDTTKVPSGVVLSGKNIYIGNGVKFGANISIADNVHIGENVSIGSSVNIEEGTYIDNNVEIESDTNISLGSFVSSIGEYNTTNYESLANDLQKYHIRLENIGTIDLIIDEQDGTESRTIDLNEYTLFDKAAYETPLSLNNDFQRFSIIAQKGENITTQLFDSHYSLTINMKGILNHSNERAISPILVNDDTYIDLVVKMISKDAYRPFVPYFVKAIYNITTSNDAVSLSLLTNVLFDFYAFDEFNEVNSSSTILQESKLCHDYIIQKENFAYDRTNIGLNEYEYIFSQVNDYVDIESCFSGIETTRSVLPDLNKITAPTLLLSGKYDAFYPQTWATSLEKSLSTTVWNVDVKNSGNTASLENCGTSLVTQFIEDSSTKPTTSNGCENNESLNIYNPVIEKHRLDNENNITNGSENL
jgi:pimeloyl-ACP methyl ester carboxylesterase